MNLINRLRLNSKWPQINYKLKTLATAFILLIIFISKTIIYDIGVQLFKSNIDQKETYISLNYEDPPMHQKNITKNYVVDNPLCRIPEFNPSHESIKKYLIKENLKICSKLPPLTSVTFSATTKKHTLKVNALVVDQYLTNQSSLKCCFLVITRGDPDGSENGLPDDRWRKQEIKCFENEVEIPENAEYMYVSCTSKKKRVFQTIYFLVVDKKPKAIPSNAKTAKKKYSLFMFAIDAVSRLNFIRSMPKTRKYIEARGWLPLEGYVKVGENTFPNAIPILTGMKVAQLKNLCYHHQYQPFDDCPFIWKMFSKNGYLTSYCEDQIWMSTFNLEKYGFMNSPTDYYCRPILRLAEALIGRKKGDDFCLGPEPEIEPLFRFNAEFVKHFHDRLYFNLFWTNSFSHNDMNRLMTMDDRVRNFLQDIEPYLNSTVVILFGDHGFRGDAFRSTYLGWHEDRTPFIYFYLPPSLKASHPSWYRNLQANKNKLTSPFDLHATLLELLFDKVPRAPAGCLKCSSLFASVPNNRSCADAGVDEAWCPCWTANNSNSDFKPPTHAPCFPPIV